jgi:hypothetical protein
MYGNITLKLLCTINIHQFLKIFWEGFLEEGTFGMRFQGVEV